MVILWKDSELGARAGGTFDGHAAGAGRQLVQQSGQEGGLAAAHLPHQHHQRTRPAAHLSFKSRENRNSIQLKTQYATRRSLHLPPASPAHPACSIMTRERPAQNWELVPGLWKVRPWRV